MTYRDLDSFYREDPCRGRSRESDFGVWHRGRVSLRAMWLEATGELYGLTLTGSGAGRVRLLAELPPSGHPNPRRSDLIAEAALVGWAERSGRPRSLAWLERRLGHVRQAARADRLDRRLCQRGLSPARRGDRPEADDWGETCDSCVAPRLVVGRGLSPVQLESKLRAGCRWLADAEASGAPEKGAR